MNTGDGLPNKGVPELTRTDEPFYPDIVQCPRCFGFFPGTYDTGGAHPKPHVCLPQKFLSTEIEDE